MLTVTNQPNNGLQLQGGNVALQGNTTPLQGGSAPAQTMGLQTPSPQVKTSAPKPIVQNVTDLSAKYANVGGTLYNTQTGQKFSNPQDFFKDSGQGSFANLKFNTTYTPTGKESIYGQSNPNAPQYDQQGMLVPGTGGLASSPAPSSAPTTPAPAPVSPLNSAGFSTSQNPDQNTQAYPNAYSGTTTPDYSKLGQEASQLSTPSQQEIDLSNKIAQYKNTANQAYLGTGTVGDLEGATGRQATEQQSANSTLQSMESELANLQAQRQAALTGVTTQAGLIKPQPVSPGQSLINPSTGQSVGGVPEFSPTQNIAGAPVPFNVTTGMIGAGATGQGLLGSLGSPNVSSAVSSVLQGLGANDPSTNAFITNAVSQALANGGNVPSTLDSKQSQIVQQVLSQMTGGQYSSTASGINLANQASQSAQAQEITPIARTALTNLQALQALSDKVGYSNSPITNDIRNAFSGTFLTDPNINNLTSALQYVTGEVSQVLGGGSSTVAALNDAQAALQANRLSPDALKQLIATSTQLVNNRLSELSSPTNTVTVPNGLQMPQGFSASGTSGTSGSSTGPISSLDLKL